MPDIAENQLDTVYGFDRIMKIIDVVLNNFGRIVGLVGGVFLSFIVFLTSADVIMRIFLNSPILGTQELVQFSNLIMSFLMMLWSSLGMKHIRMNALEQYFPLGLQKILEIFFLLLILGIFSIMTLYNFQFAIAQQRSLETSLLTNIPIFLFYVIISVICGFMCLIFLIHIIRLAREALKKWV